MTNVTQGENKDEQGKRELRELEGRNVAWYSVMLSAFVQMKLERDKTLITLSAIGIGLLLTILTAVGMQRWWEIWLYGGALLSFLMTIAGLLAVLTGNSKLIEHQLREKREESSKAILELNRLDEVSVISFVVAVIFVVAISIASGVGHFRSAGGATMPEDTKQQEPEEKRSLSGIEKLKPEEPSQETDKPPSDEGESADAEPNEGSD